MSGKLCAYFPVYEDVDALRFSIKKTKEYGITTIITVDGPFHGFEHKFLKSKDGSLDFLKKEGCIVLQSGLCYEQDKLNMAFHEAARLGFDYVLLLGADEWPEGNIQEFISRLDNLHKDHTPKIPYIAVKEHQPKSKWNRDIQESPKVFIEPMFIRARYTHWCYYIYNQRTAFTECVVPGIIVHHDDSIRPKSRNNLMDKFQDNNVTRESGIMAKLEIIQDDDRRQEISYGVLIHDFSTPKVKERVMENGVTEWIITGFVHEQKKLILENGYKVHTWTDSEGYHVIPFRWSERLKLV